MRVYRNPGCYQASRAEQSVRRGAIRALEETVLRTTLYFVSHGKPSSSRRSRSPQPPRQSTELAGPHQHMIRSSMVPISIGELPSLMAICLVGAAVMSYWMHTFLHPFCTIWPACTR